MSFTQANCFRPSYHSPVTRIPKANGVCPIRATASVSTLLSHRRSGKWKQSSAVCLFGGKDNKSNGGGDEVRYAFSSLLKVMFFCVSEMIILLCN